MIQKLRNKPLIINSDLDGILSGLLLKKYLNCNIVGFSNSEKEIWIHADYKESLNAISFVDLFVANPNLVSIDQHIIAANEQHHLEISKNNKKINPNIINSRFHFPSSSYRSKYPFGTVHFLIALLEREGINLGDLKLNHTIQGIQFIDLILRADDTMKTSIYSSYTENAAEWWRWLIQLSSKGHLTTSLKNYLDGLTKKKAENIKINVGKFLKNAPFNCDSSEGGIRQLTTNWFIKEKVFTYMELLCEFVETPMIKLGGKFNKYNGIAERMSLSKSQLKELIEIGTIDEKRIFSYAFVRSVSRDENFSVTFYQKN